jgi:hypothetical protein
MNKYERLKAELAAMGTGTMTCFGSSMLPLLPNPSTCTYLRQDDYTVGDIVFCKVKGRYIDAHKITKKGADGRYMISNNHGYDNGWTRQIFGRVVRAVDRVGNMKTF